MLQIFKNILLYQESNFANQKKQSIINYNLMYIFNQMGDPLLSNHKVEFLWLQCLEEQPINLDLQDYTFAQFNTNEISSDDLDFFLTKNQNCGSLCTYQGKMEQFGAYKAILGEKKYITTQDTFNVNHSQGIAPFILKENTSITEPLSRTTMKSTNQEKIEMINITTELNSIETKVNENKVFPTKKNKVFKKETNHLKKRNSKQKKSKQKKNKKKSKLKKIESEKLKQKIRLRNQTKNIIKNFGKQIIRFVCQNQSIITKVLVEIISNITYQYLNEELQQNRKRVMSKIEHLREMWVNEYYGRQMRFISIHFLKKYSHNWIFNSKIEDIKSSLKYKHRLQSALTNPTTFLTLKWP